MQQLAIVFCLLLLSCSKDDAQETPLGNWTVGGETFTAKEYGRSPLSVQWFDRGNSTTNTTDPISGVVVEFSEEVPLDDATFAIQRIPTPGVNICQGIRLIVDANTPDARTYKINQRIDGQQSIGSVFIESGKRYMSINSMKLYQISDAGVVLDSTMFSAKKLEY